MTQDTRELVERVARAWASIDGKSALFDSDDGSNELLGYRDGYMSEAEELLRRSGVSTTLSAQAERIAELEKERSALRLLVEELERVLPADRRSYRALRARVADARAALAGKGEA